MKRSVGRGTQDGRLLNPFFQLEAQPDILARATDAYINTHWFDEKAQLNAGEFYLQAASRMADQDEAHTVLGRAVECWDNSVSLQARNASHIDWVAGVAKKQLAYQYVYAWRILNPQTLPPTNIKTHTYTEILNAAQAHMEAIEAIREEHGPYSMQISELAGNVAELELLALGMRFGLKLGDDSWLPTPSLYSEDSGTKRYSSERNGWDVSIFTQLESDQPPELTYKVQVKSTDNNSHLIPSKTRAYDDDIAVICVRNDLAWKIEGRPNMTLRIGTIASECLHEYSGVATQSEIQALDTREELLLEKLG